MSIEYKMNGKSVDQKLLEKQQTSNIQNETKKEIIEIVMRQTNYDEKKSIEKLEEFNYNINETIRDYMVPIKRSTENNSNCKSANQMLYREFRNFLDDASMNYEKRKREYEKQNY
jgi:hypothetical protein